MLFEQVLWTRQDHGNCSWEEETDCMYTLGEPDLRASPGSVSTDSLMISPSSWLSVPCLYHGNPYFYLQPSPLQTCVSAQSTSPLVFLINTSSLKYITLSSLSPLPQHLPILASSTSVFPATWSHAWFLSFSHTPTNNQKKNLIHIYIWDSVLVSCTVTPAGV